MIFLKPIAITLVIFGMVFTIGYYIFSEEYKFIGQETKIVHAEITDSYFVPRLGGYSLRIIYEYEFQDQKYKGNKRLGKSDGIYYKRKYFAN